MPETFDTPSGSITKNFNKNTNSAIVAFDASPTAMPESGTVPIQHTTPVGSPTINFSKNLNSPIRAY
jgi:hypothetical protein